MQADVNFIGCPDKFIGQARPTAAAEDNSGCFKGPINFLVPPAGVPKLHNVAARGIELARDRVQSRSCVAVTRRQLEQQAAHPFSQNIGDDAEIPNQRLCALEPSYMRDELADLYGVNELFPDGLAAPGLDVGNRRPRVKGCVNLDAVEALQVVREPVLL